MIRSRHGLPTLMTLLACSLASCMAMQPGTGSQPGIEDGDVFSLRAGDSVHLSNAGRLTYVALLDDSRCPSGVQCIWAGEAQIAFNWQPVGSAQQRITLTTGPGRGRWILGNHQLILQGAAPGPDPEITLALQAAVP